MMKTNPQTPNNLFVLGNGESRHGYNLEQFRQWGKIYGCNALYRDFKPDGLISTDWAMMHEIYSSGYCFDNKCYFRQWKVLPYQFYDMMQYTGLEQSGLDKLNKRLEELDEKPSIFNPIWYGLSFTMGAIAGMAGDKWSLGFVHETEEQVVKHLKSHMDKIPASDARTA